MSQGQPLQEGQLIDLIRGSESADEAVGRIKLSFDEVDRRVFEKRAPIDPAEELPLVLSRMLDEDDLEVLRYIEGRIFEYSLIDGTRMLSSSTSISTKDKYFFAGERSKNNTSRKKLILLSLICTSNNEDAEPETMGHSDPVVYLTRLGKTVLDILEKGQKT